MPHRDDAFIDDVAVYRGFLAVDERSNAQRKVRIVSWDGKRSELIEAEDSTYVMRAIDTPDPQSRRARYKYSSPTTPTTQQVPMVP